MSTENRRVLHLLPISKDAEELYRSHGTFHEGDSGLDLFVVEEQTIKPNETAFLKLGIKCAAYDENNHNVSWLAMPRSSISKTPLRLANSVGLIDAGYRGEIIACVDNIKTVDYTVKKGDRWIQAVFPDLKPFSFKIVDALTETSRGEAGFGSTTKAVAKPTAADEKVVVAPEEPTAMIDVAAEVKEKVEEQKKPDVEEADATKTKDENETPQVESKKRASETVLENKQVKKTRSNSSTTTGTEGVETPAAQ